jgi:peptidyl-prolyl cis-trans isomerase SurA
MKEHLSDVIKHDERSQIPQKLYVEKLKKEYNYTFYKENFEPFLKAFESIENSGDSASLKNMVTSKIPLFRLKNQDFTQKQFSAFLSHKKIDAGNLNETYSAFVRDKVLAYEDSQLEKKYPEFGHLMQEYRDGILLFDISNQKVWEKASKDTVGLASFFASNKVKYSWEKPHFKGYVIQCANDSVAKQAKKMVENMQSDSVATALKRTFNTGSKILVKIDRGLYEQGENANVDFLAFKKGNVDTKSGFPEIFIKGSILEKGPETYTDVCGLVISDYQNYLDTKWIESLKGKFKVIVYKDVVNSVNKN